MAVLDLTTLAALKSWLGIASTSDDALLAGLISDVSTAILVDLGRASIGPAIYNEVRDGGGETSILLRHWPVGAVLAFTIDGLAVAMSGALPAGGTLLSGVLDGADPAPPGAPQRLSLLRGLMPHGLQNIVVSYRAGYEVAAEAALVPSTAPYTVNALAPYGAWYSDGAVAYANGVALQPGTAPVQGTYTVSSGTYTFSAADAGASLSLRYGYIPADLARACCEWAADRYVARSRIGQSSKSLGGQETTAFIVKAMPDVVDRLLQPYRRVIAP